MIRRSATVFALLLISACSATGPQTLEPAATNDAVGSGAAMASESSNVTEIGVLQESNLDESDLETPSKHNWNCRRETVIGSNMRRKVCGPPRGEGADTEVARSALNRNAIRMDETNKVSE